MNKQSGFSLIELIIVVGIIAILATIALPSFTSYIQKGRRAEAQQALLGMANEQALWRSNNASYASYVELGSPASAHHTLAISDVSATGFTLTATGNNDQANDSEQSTSCSPITYALNGTVVGKNPPICWSR